MGNGTIDVPFQAKKLDSKEVTIDGLLVQRQNICISDGRSVAFSSRVSPLGEVLQQAPIRLIGQAFTGATLDTRAWATSGIVGTGAATLSGDGTATLSTGVTANSAVILRSTKSARFMFGHANMLRYVIKTADAGATNNVRRIGVGDGVNELGFVISGTSFGIYYINNSVLTDVLSGFNGELGATLNHSSSAKALEIVYFTAGFWFFVDGQLLHSIVLSALSDPLVRNLTLPLKMSNINSGGSTTNVSLSVWNSSVFRLGNDQQRPNFANINTNTTTILKLGAGTLRRIIINTNGATNNIATVYDNTAGSGTLIATINTTAAVGGVFEYNLDFSVGLTIVTATGTAANITVIYD